MTELQAEYPDQYWHWRVAVEDPSGEIRKGFSHDQDFNSLQSSLLAPWQANSTFSVGGVLVRDRERVIELQIVNTERDSKYINENNRRRHEAKGIVGFSYDPNMLPFEFDNPPDLTNELLELSLTTEPPRADLEMILRLCERLPLAHTPIRDRRKGKQTYEIEDEYDVHDLLLAVIRGYIEDAIDEDPLSKVGGARAARLDIGIPAIGILIEVKFAREAGDQKKLVEQLSEDLILYTEWPPLQHLIFYIFNSGILRDPEALNDLAGPHEIRGVQFDAHVVLV